MNTLIIVGFCLVSVWLGGLTVLVLNLRSSIAKVSSLAVDCAHMAARHEAELTSFFKTLMETFDVLSSMSQTDGENREDLM